MLEQTAVKTRRKGTGYKYLGGYFCPLQGRCGKKRREKYMTRARKALSFLPNMWQDIFLRNVEEENRGII